MSSYSRTKGRNLENLVAQTLNESGIQAERVPLSGSLGGKYSSDVVLGTVDHTIARIECKFRENISKQLWDWLGGNDFLVVKRSRLEPLVVMSLERFIQEGGLSIQDARVRIGEV